MKRFLIAGAVLGVGLFVVGAGAVLGVALGARTLVVSAAALKPAVALAIVPPAGSNGGNSPVLVALRDAPAR